MHINRLLYALCFSSGYLKYANVVHLLQKYVRNLKQTINFPYEICLAVVGFGITRHRTGSHHKYSVTENCSIVRRRTLPAQHYRRRVKDCFIVSVFIVTGLVWSNYVSPH